MNTTATGTSTRWSAIRLLAISATAPEPQAVAAFDSFLLKPFTGPQLAAAIESAAPAAAPAQSAETPILDEAVY